MFSGPGISAFFQPLRVAGAEAAPSAAIQPARKAGDDPQRGHAPPHKPDKPEHAAPPAADVAADFAEDHTTLSIPALRALLTGETAGTSQPPHAGDSGTGAETPPALRAAAAAYQHAAAARTPDAPAVPAGFMPPPRDQATAADILLMLAQAEAAGIREIAVRDGASIYDTLAALCWSLQR